MGRKSIFGKPLTDAERAKRYRDSRKAELEQLRALVAGIKKPSRKRAGAGPKVSADNLIHDSRQVDLEQMIDQTQKNMQ